MVQAKHPFCAQAEHHHPVLNPLNGIASPHKMRMEFNIYCPRILLIKYVLSQAEHEAPVTSVGVSPDGLRVACGTENGSIGMLDVAGHRYSTLLRSHSGTINALAIDPSRSVH